MGRPATWTSISLGAFVIGMLATVTLLVVGRWRRARAGWLRPLLLGLMAGGAIGCVAITVETTVPAALVLALGVGSKVGSRGSKTVLKNQSCGKDRRRF